MNSFFDELKFRTSWGQTGNDRFDANNPRNDEWFFMDTFGFGGGMVFGHQNVSSIYQQRVPNPNITWEVANQFNVKVEATFLNDHMSVELDWGNPEHASAPYENRDPRFYATILYDGAQWRPRPTEGAEIEPHGIIQTFERLTLPNGDTRAGLDTRNGPIEDWNGGYSRYYLRKFIDPNVNHSSSEKQEVPWRVLRYAEVLLNYAEASIELGDDADARRELNKIRARAGMPDIQDSGEALKERYRNERRVELAFEEHRYFDIRRWKIAPEVMVNAQGIEIMVEATDYRDRDTYFNYQYNIIPNINQRGWNDRSYFTPIDINEMRRNDSLRQNPGYGGN